MKTTKEERGTVRGHMKHPGAIDTRLLISIEFIERLLDDAYELARLREGLNDKAATWKGTVSAMQERIDRADDKYEEHLGYRHALEDCADEVQELLNGDGDG